ncbi:radical SAM protein [Micromonospora sp. NPDC005652]|uniref:B12-binding domain-containing radical SAM protein n=1 Tax=Micromonospora sp. NPDC005652 TaxID=3157046 RepID=UPI0033E4201D
MRVVLIRAPEDELHDDRLDPPLGLIYLACAVEDAGHEVSLVDLCGGRDFSEIPVGDLYGISAFTTSYHVALKILRFLREREPKAVVIAGGPHVSAVKGKVLSEGFDYAFVGEAERTLPEAVEPIARRQYLNRLIEGPEVRPLDSVRFDFGVVDLPSYTRTVENRRSATLLSARGCPYKCRFCWTPNNFGAIRFHSTEYLRTQLLVMRDEYGIDAVTFHDDSFLADRARAFEVMDLLADLGFIWRAECNLLHLKPDVCERLVRTGCKHVLVGVETGSVAMLRAMRKPQNQSVISEGIHNAVAAGLTIRASLLVGFPGETWETVRESVAFLNELPFQEYSLYNFTPFPGTDPYENPQRYGIEWISEDYADFYLLKGYNQANYSYRTKDFGPEQLAEWREYMITELDRWHAPSVRVEGKWTIGSEK